MSEFSAFDFTDASISSMETLIEDSQLKVNRFVLFTLNLIFLWAANSETHSVTVVVYKIQKGL